MMKSSVSQRASFRLICVGLALLSLAVYSRLLTCDFIDFDDPDYVTENQHVLDGLTLNGFAWAFRSTHAVNWHPLTWISHMADCQVYGLSPGGHHFSSLLLHMANTLLLFGVLRRLTGALWRSALVAALFAWHPLHVESVAWVSERKDVLSAFFWFLALGAYGRYAEKSKVQGPKSEVRGFYLLALLFFVLGLLSKPMVVTLPFVLLLLDYWPLQRSPELSERSVAVPWSKLVWEKLPFFLLAAVASFVTFSVQKSGGAVNSLEHLSFSQRVINALVAYALYLGKMIWPDRLAYIYPLRFSWPVWQVLLALGLLIAVTMLAVLFRRTRPYLLVGWLWFVGTLVPVIGLVQVGAQSMADRYTYVPLIGIFIMLVWLAGEVACRRQEYRRFVWVGAFLVLAGCLARTWSQAGVWRNGQTLCTHALAVTARNYVAHVGLGIALGKLGRDEDALAEYKTALEIAPNDPSALANKGHLFKRQGRLDEAIAAFQAALSFRPADAGLHYDLANALVARGRLAEAVEHYLASLRLDPDAADAHNNLGAVLVRLGQSTEAIEQFEAALKAQSNFPEAEDQLGSELQRLNRLDEARVHLAQAVRLRPDLVHARLKLGLLLAQQSHFDEAKAQLGRVTELEPLNSAAWYNLAAVLAAQGRWEEAAQDFGKVTELKPQDADAHARRGAALAQAGQREPAITEYERAAELTAHREPRILAGLDQAYASAGRFEEALAIAQQAQAAAKALNQPALAEEAAQRLERYRAGKP